MAMDADPQTGASVYDSYNDTNGAGAWMKTGGTSLASALWAALIAIADQGRIAAGGTTLDGAGQVLPALYALPGSDFHDITTGGNGVFNAGPGYDQSTGLGSPSADLVRPRWPITTWRPGWGSARARRRWSRPGSRST